MNKRIALITMTACIADINGCSEKSMDVGCTIGDTKCDGGVVYSCEADVSRKAYWHPIKICENGCANTNDGQNYCNCVLGEIKCHDDGNVYECIANDSNTFDWKNLRNCSAGCMSDGNCMCENDAKKCENGVRYTCSVEANSSEWKPIEICEYGCTVNGECGCEPDRIKCAENKLFKCTTDISNGMNYWSGSTECKTQCADDTSCEAKEGCALGVKDDGSCILATDCSSNAHNEDGTCKPLLECKNGYNLNGSCFCPDYCANSCNEYGECKCPEACVSNKCDANGSICCPEGCVNGCNDNGECICSKDCPNGCDSLGNCCGDNCLNGCEWFESKTQCSCPNYCSIESEPNSGTYCDVNGTCIKKAGCMNGWEQDGSCHCPNCQYGCDAEIGSCYIPTTGCGSENNECEQNEYCSDNTICLPIDSNNNYIYDNLEVNYPQKGVECKTDDDCGEQGFCDSFLGYRCSQRCTSDTECIKRCEDSDATECTNALNYDLICRPDGRCAPDTFVTVWNMTEDNLELTLPKSDDCHFSIDWGDHTNEDVTDCSNGIKHTYQSPNEYTVKIKSIDADKSKGVYKDFSMMNSASGGEKHPNALNLIRIESFGPVGLSAGAFKFCENLTNVSAIDIPDATYLIDMSDFFMCTINFNDRIENWDVSNVMSMKNLFAITRDGNCGKENISIARSKFNQPLGNWNVSKVKNMSALFFATASFNQPISQWNVSNVEDMSRMFSMSQSFNQSLAGWNVSKVRNMGSMFYKASKFDTSINAWNVSNVEDMSNMFNSTGAYNQPLNSWNVSNVKTMSNMFNNAQKFAQELSNWNTSNVTNMSGMFQNAKAFNSNLFNSTNNVTNMSNMFRGATSFNQSLNNWDTSIVTDMSNMFDGATSFNQNISEWHVTRNTKLCDMFKDNTLNNLTNINRNLILASTNWEAKPWGITGYHNDTCSYY